MATDETQNIPERPRRRRGERRQPGSAPGAAARRPARHGHLPRDDRPPPGRPRPQRQGARPRRPHLAAGRARHPALERAGGDQQRRRAVPRRHPGQDRPGDPAPGRDDPRDRPGPAPHPAARPAPDRAASRGARRGHRRRDREDARGRGAHGLDPRPDRAVREQRRVRSRRRWRSPRATSATAACWPT